MNALALPPRLRRLAASMRSRDLDTRCENYRIIDDFSYRQPLIWLFPLQLSQLPFNTISF